MEARCLPEVPNGGRRAGDGTRGAPDAGGERRQVRGTFVRFEGGNTPQLASSVSM